MSTSDISIAGRVDALARAVRLADGRLDQRIVDDARATVDKVQGRIRHGTDSTIVALGGSTGVGKSSLLNSVVGDEVVDVGVRRPTTSAAHAVVWTAERESSPALDGLLDWLGVRQRHRIDVERQDPRNGLVVIDLPDFDSIEHAHHEVVDAVIALVDVIIWVTDPQKYADEAFHVRYLRPHVEHAEAMRFVFNKLDIVPTDQHGVLISDFAHRLREDGLGEREIVAASVTTGIGIDDVDALLRDAADRRRAAAIRLDADIRQAVVRMTPQESGPERTEVTGRAVDELVERLSSAAGVEVAADIVASQHRRDGRRATGPAALRIAPRLRQQPIAKLARATSNSVAESEIGLGLRNFADAASTGLESPWPRVLRARTAAHAETLRPPLSTLTTRTAHIAVRRPGWWRPVRHVQRLLLIATLIGALWLLAAAVAGGFLQLDTEPLLPTIPGTDSVTVPTALLIGGLIASVAVGLLCRVPIAISARRRAARLRTRLRGDVAEIAASTVVADVEATLVDRAELFAALDVARGG